METEENGQRVPRIRIRQMILSSDNEDDDDGGGDGDGEVRANSGTVSISTSSDEDETDDEIQTVRIQRRGLTQAARMRRNNREQHRRAQQHRTRARDDLAWPLLSASQFVSSEDDHITIDDNNSDNDIEVTGTREVPDTVEVTGVVTREPTVIDRRTAFHLRAEERRRRARAAEEFETRNGRNGNININGSTSRRTTSWHFPGFRIELPANLFNDIEDTEEVNQHEEEEDDGLLHFPPRRIPPPDRGLLHFPPRRIPPPDGWPAPGYSDEERPPILMSREDQLFREALLRSLRDTGIERPQIREEDIKGVPIPTETRAGFTRSIKATQTSVCARCECELGVGLQTDESARATEGDKLLSKRVFFAKCGHVYCGRCVNETVNRKQGKKRDPYRTCAVDKCPARFNRIKKPFTEVYY